MEMDGNGHQGEVAVIDVAYFKIIFAMEVERRDKGSALFNNNNNNNNNNFIYLVSKSAVF